MIQNQEKLANEELRDLNAEFPHLEFAFIFCVAFCHLCKRKKAVFCCYKNFKAQSCSKKYCNDCMRLHYAVDLKQVIRTQKDWLCPYKLGGCVCPKCNQDKENYTNSVQQLQTSAANFSSTVGQEQTAPTKVNQQSSATVEGAAAKQEASATQEGGSSTVKVRQEAAQIEVQGGAMAEIDQQIDDLFVSFDDEALARGAQPQLVPQEQVQNEEQSRDEAKDEDNEQEQEEAKLQTDSSVLTLKNRLVRLLSDPDMKTKQGALEYNAFLIKNLVSEMKKSSSELTQEQRTASLSLLFLNLRKLAQSADQFMEQSIERHSLLEKLEALQNQNGTTEYNDLIKLIAESKKGVPDGLRLNQLAKLCSSAENFIELDAEQALYHEYDRSCLQRGFELDLEQILLAHLNKTQAQAQHEQKMHNRREKKLAAKRQQQFQEQQQQKSLQIQEKQKQPQEEVATIEQDASLAGHKRTERPNFEIEMLEEVENNPNVELDEDDGAFTITINLGF